MFSKEHIKNQILNIISEHPSSEDHFESKSQDNIYPSNQSFEQPEEELNHLIKSDLERLTLASDPLLKNITLI